jgi:class 3 adenylate cyclase/pimeloyl-ACP methyl ester carboxylesterase
MSLLRNPPETHYADTGEGFVAYQTFGEGPDLLYLNDVHSNVEVMWEQPLIADFFDRLSSFARVTYLDHRSSGISDTVPNVVVDHWVDDIRFVMEDAGIAQATLVGDAEGGPGAMMFTAAHPNRVSALILSSSFARWTRADDFPIGMPQDALDRLVDLVRWGWGKPGFFNLPAPSTVDDPKMQEWLARYQRLSAPPSWATNMAKWYAEVDVRAILETINVPTLVITRKDAVYHRPAHGEYLAEHIQDARLAELPGADSSPYFIDPGPVLDEIEEFMTGVRPRPVSDRTLATVMFTDIVDSTGHLARLGDQQWMRVLGQHDQLTRDYLHQYRGTERHTVGDGFLATFDGPTRAVTCAADLKRAMPELGIDIRAGLHTGEVELTGDGIGGLAVHIAARVIDAEPGSGVMVSSTVKDLVVGSGIEFEARGPHELKGVPGEWQLFSVSDLP